MADVTIDVPFHALRLTLNPKSDVQAGMLRDLATPAGYEPGAWGTFHELLKPGDAMIDVGAHVGVFTCLAASLVGRSGQVMAFEPNAENRGRLIGNVKKNNLEWQTCIDKRAVTDIAERLSFFRCADNDGGHALYNPGNAAYNVKTRAAPKQAIVETTTLDQAVPADWRVKLIKIDTEGAEAHVLRGAARILDTDRPSVIAEINAFGLDQMRESEQSLRQILQSRGYSEYALQDVHPFRIPITPEQTAQQRYMDGNVLCLPVYNMLFTPEPL